MQSWFHNRSGQPTFILYPFFRPTGTLFAMGTAGRLRGPRSTSRPGCGRSATRSTPQDAYSGCTRQPRCGLVATGQPPCSTRLPIEIPFEESLGSGAGVRVCVYTCVAFASEEGASKYVTVHYYCNIITTIMLQFNVSIQVVEHCSHAHCNYLQRFY